MSRNHSKQSSHSQFNDVISILIFFLDTTVPSTVDSTFEKSTSSSDLAQTSIHCSQSNWFESIDFNVFTDAISAFSTQQQRTFITVLLPPTYCSQSTWFKFNDFQFFANITLTRLTQLSQFASIDYSSLDWFISNDLNSMITFASLTQSSLFEFNNFSRELIDRQQSNWFKYNDLQHSFVNLSTTSSQIY